ncbi:MAG: hypothetical protein ACI8PB_004400 [Desulforhopalus sp.]|jgi:hypothetical protein
MIYIAHAFDIHVAGCHMVEKEIKVLLAGRTFPGPLLEGKSHAAWHPDDYIFTHQESTVAKDEEELSVVLDSIGEELMNYVTENTGPMSISTNGYKKRMLET